MTTAALTVTCVQVIYARSHLMKRVGVAVARRVSPGRTDTLVMCDADLTAADAVAILVPMLTRAEDDAMRAAYGLPAYPAPHGLGQHALLPVPRSMVYPAAARAAALVTGAELDAYASHAVCAVCRRWGCPGADRCAGRADASCAYD